MTNDISDFQPLLRNCSLSGEAKKTVDIFDGDAELHYTLFGNSCKWSIAVRRTGGFLPTAEATIRDITDDYALAEHIFMLLLGGAAHPEHCRDIIEDILT